MSGDFDRAIVESTVHRPWPMPPAPWLMTQTWHDLLFAHWRVDVSEVRRVFGRLLTSISSTTRPGWKSYRSI